MKKGIKLLASLMLLLMTTTLIMASCSKADDIKPQTNEPLPVPRRG